MPCTQPDPDAPAVWSDAREAADIAIQAEQIIYLKQMMAERIALHTGQTIERIEADSDRDRWFTAQEALDYGFIDRVIDAPP